jgi:hypothetical protein
VLRSVRIPLEHDDEASEPPWSVLAAHLTDLVGVSAYRFEETVLLTEDSKNVDGEVIPVASESYERMVIVDYNSLTISEADLTSAITSSWFGAGRAENRGRIGRKIIIPPDAPA